MGWIRKSLTWLWASLGNIIWIAGLASSFALPAWAVNVTGLFAEYAPFSWVAAGFLGLAAGAASMATYAWAKGRLVRVAYDAKLIAQGGAIDPLAKTFERRRIHLNEFCLPSHPFIEGKTFIDCHIIGPANIILLEGNSVTDHQLPICDAMVLAPGSLPNNGYAFRNCVFRNRSFQRITLMFSLEEYQSAMHVNWLRWISIQPDQQSLPLEAPTPPVPTVSEPPTEQAEEAE